MIEVLFEYGYLQSDDERKQQFRCDLHGDTLDQKASARVYPENNSTYCFACGVSRDIISWTMEKEDLDFTAACRFLERRFELEPWVYSQRPEESEKEEVEPDFKRTDTFIRMCGESGAIPFNKYIRAYDIFDQIHHLFQKGKEGGKIQSMLDNLREKILEPAREAS